MITVPRMTCFSCSSGPAATTVSFWEHCVDTESSNEYKMYVFNYSTISSYIQTSAHSPPLCTMQSDDACVYPPVHSVSCSRLTSPPMQSLKELTTHTPYHSSSCLLMVHGCKHTGHYNGSLEDSYVWLLSVKELILCVCVKNLLDIGVGADDVFYLIRVGVLEGEAAGSDQHPLPVLHAEAVHHGQNLPLQLHHLQREDTHWSVSLFSILHSNKTEQSLRKVPDWHEQPEELQCASA